MESERVCDATRGCCVSLYVVSNSLAMGEFGILPGVWGIRLCGVFASGARGMGACEKPVAPGAGGGVCVVFGARDLGESPSRGGVM